MKETRVVAAIIVKNGRVLAAQRASHMRHPGKWEFPGGKVEMGESDEDAMVRELGEELGICASVESELVDSVHEYSDRVIRLIGLRCRVESGSLEAREHSAILWQPIDELDGLDWADADWALVEAIQADRTL